MSGTSIQFGNTPWTFADIEKAHKDCEQIAVHDEDGLKLDVYPNQLEVITSAQMVEAYATHAMPIMYPHWSYGKSHLMHSSQYETGESGLAYEIVSNSNPCISYLMEDNTLTTQILVIAHAAFGHNFVFKNNYLFKERTDAEGIVEYLKYAKRYILEMELKHGYKKVERLLDHAHALQFYGVDKYKRPAPLSEELTKEAQTKREEMYRQQYRPEWKALPDEAYARMMAEGQYKDKDVFPEEPQENLLRFIKDHSPVLEPYQREILGIVCNLSEYFYPQRQTKVLNEGAASFVHYFIMNRLHEKGILNAGHMIEFLKLHTGVLRQSRMQVRMYNGMPQQFTAPDFNPYWLGYTILTDLKRICENPTPEDRKWFPEYAGKPWLPVWKDAVCNFRDGSFIHQFLSPKVMREHRFLSMVDKTSDTHIRVEAIQDDDGYSLIRSELGKNYDLSRRMPEISVVNCDIKRSRVMKLQFTRREGRNLHRTTALATLQHVKEMWGFPVTLASVDTNGVEYDSMSL